MKIGLIAMNGIRVADEALSKMGLTLPGVLDRGRAVASMPSLALLTLAGLTPAKHTVEYLEVPDLSLAKDIPQDFDLVAISSYSAQILEAYELSDAFRSAGIKVVMGGPHVTSLPQEAAHHCDAVAIGEGEAIWSSILEDCQKNQLKQFYGAPFSKFDMSDAPMPRFELLDASKYNRLTVQTSRGCPHRCEFCASSLILTDRYKQKPAAKVLAEIDRIKEIWRRPFIEFADDNSFVDKQYWLDLLPQLRNRQVRWFAETDLSVAEDETLLGLMSDSGCAQVLVGLESPSSAHLDKVELRNNWKMKRFWRYKQAVRKIQSYGIRVIGCFVLGLDGQGPEVFDELYDFAIDLELFDVQVTVLTAFPGTPLFSRLDKQGRILESENWNKCTLFDVNFQPDCMSADQLKDGFKNLVQRLYTQELTEWRRESFRRNLKVTRKAS